MLHGADGLDGVVPDQAGVHPGQRLLQGLREHHLGERVQQLQARFGDALVIIGVGVVVIAVVWFVAFRAGETTADRFRPMLVLPRRR